MCPLWTLSFIRISGNQIYSTLFLALSHKHDVMSTIYKKVISLVIALFHNFFMILKNWGETQNICEGETHILISTRSRQCCNFGKICQWLKKPRHGTVFKFMILYFCNHLFTPAVSLCLSVRQPSSYQRNKKKVGENIRYKNLKCVTITFVCPSVRQPSSYRRNKKY